MSPGQLVRSYVDIICSLFGSLGHNLNWFCLFGFDVRQLLRSNTQIFTVMYIRTRKGQEKDKEMRELEAEKRKQDKERKREKYWWGGGRYREGRRGQLGGYEKKWRREMGKEK